MELRSLLNQHLKENPIQYRAHPGSNKVEKIESFTKLESLIKSELEYWKFLEEKVPGNRISTAWRNCHNDLIKIAELRDNETVINTINGIRSRLSEQAIVFSFSDRVIYLKGLLNQEGATIEEGINLVLQPDLLSSFIESNYHRKLISVYKLLAHEMSIGEEYQTPAAMLSKYNSEIGAQREIFLSEFGKQILDQETQFNAKVLHFENLSKGSETEYQNQKKRYDDTFEELRKWREGEEKTYREKLKLEAPAHYWNTMSKDYNKKSNKWGAITIGLSVLFVTSLILLLFNFDDWKTAFQEGNQIKGIIIFSLIVTVFTFIIGLGAKIMLSNMHLSRDAAEREQLTYFYLALVKDAAENKNYQIKEQERLLVFQSLFSRADTGLIKGDTSPTMPGLGIIEKVINRGK